MRLHENWELFSAALQAASQPLEEGGAWHQEYFYRERLLDLPFLVFDGS